ncbi:hypothetical protein OVS_04225 [Mycoplasma ovis str. Michigan]|uniref:Uncharacterized protein n=1 Tax=Mycoplasma ovis str. Michigan TaxID=1415773 RepID=A0ABM5P2D0_9MOLU|nr:hypothetical protein [Mycoplasma ovis]AHC40572.1 hypothetical protein OVS_04225 [Mycoplasma ovis str. Michigan]
MQDPVEPQEHSGNHGDAHSSEMVTTPESDEKGDAKKESLGREQDKEPPSESLTREAPEEVQRPELEPSSIVSNEGQDPKELHLDTQITSPDSKNTEGSPVSISETPPQPSDLPEDSIDESLSSSKESSVLKGSAFSIKLGNYSDLESIELEPRECKIDVNRDQVSFSCPPSESTLNTQIDLSFPISEEPKLKGKDWKNLTEITIYSRVDNIGLGLIFDQGDGEIEIPIEAPEEYLQLMK